MFRLQGWCYTIQGTAWTIYDQFFMKRFEMRRVGFTLIELLVVIGIIALLSVMAIAALQSARSRSRDARRVSDIKQIQNAFELYFAEMGEYPPTVPVAGENLGDASASCLVATASAWTTLAACSGKVMMGQVPSDPANTGSYVYEYAPQGTPPNDYTLTFTLEGRAGDWPSGQHTASRTGVN